uniref:hypothetical protein n=1 Tax=Herbidospora sakaeratensis TaxID=564415 RepID=UPI0012FB2928|nr:hypothetical protein [Herbidospora sakaeratensis]
MRENVGRDEYQVRVATDAAINALYQGATSEVAAAAAKSAAESATAVQPQAPYEGISARESSPAGAMDRPERLDADQRRSHQAYPAAIMGTARRVQQRMQFAQGGSIIFLTFCVERPGMPMVPVEMKGPFLEGAISENDSVEISSGNSSRGRICTNSVYNRTTGSEVRMSKGFSAAWSTMQATQNKGMIGCQIVLVIVVLVVILAIWGFVAVNFFSRM